MSGEQHSGFDTAGFSIGGDKGTGAIPVGLDHPLFLIAGNCVIESESTTMQTAEALVQMCARLKMPLIYKSSFDKANRSSVSSYRGPGMEEGLRVLQSVRQEFGVPVITDVHEDTPIDEVASVVDVMQTPAFLSRQTNFIQRVCAAGLPVNIKKGQFMAPEDMANVVVKGRSTGNSQLMVCERGVSFGYRTLISDMRGLATMRTTGTRYSNRVAWARHRVGSGSLCRCWRVLPLRPGWPVFLWRLTRILMQHSATDPTPGHSIRWSHYLAHYWNLMRHAKPPKCPKTRC